MTKKIMIVFLLCVSVKIFPDKMSSFKDDLFFIKQYRYKSETVGLNEYVNEHRKIFNFLVKVYFDLASHRKFKFEKGIIERLNSLRFRKQPLRSIAVICDQLIQNSAFDENLHRIDIKTGLALDFYFFNNRRK